jgi:hypothetical protein
MRVIEVEGLKLPVVDKSKCVNPKQCAKCGEPYKNDLIIMTKTGIGFCTVACAKYILERGSQDDFDLIFLASKYRFDYDPEAFRFIEVR